jgi:hypothetical protein
MTATEPTQPLTKYELAEIRESAEWAISANNALRLLAEVDRLRAELATVSDEAGVQCREAAARTVRAEKERDEARAELADWMHATAEARGERDALAAKLAAVKIVADQPDRDWQKFDERLPKDFTVDAREQARRAGWRQGVSLFRDQLRAALGETGGTDAELRRPP